MTFISLTYALYLPLIFALYWVVRARRAQNVVLVAASYFFYMWWDWRFFVLLFSSTLVDFLVGRFLGGTEKRAKRIILLCVSIIVNLALLGFFKYAGFFVESFVRMLAQAGIETSASRLDIILPIGISFYTLQTLGYTIDVFKKKFKPTKSFLDYLVYVSFFPQLVSGPIERAGNLLPQFAGGRTFDYAQAADGLRQILWGFFKKMVLADNLMLIANGCYGSYETMSGPALFIATACVAFRVYCDFSAYSDIAIGTAKLFGIKLMLNFNYPFFAPNLREFWRRWHISLSTWFRDYLYIPLGGSRKGRGRMIFAVLFVFTLSGLWHGASWHMVLWGFLNGILLVPLFFIKPRRCGADDRMGLSDKAQYLVKVLCTFSVFTLALVLFRAESVTKGFAIYGKIFGDVFSAGAYGAMFGLFAKYPATFIVLALFIIVEYVKRREAHPLKIDRWPLALRWMVYTALFWVIVLMSAAGTQPFVYFRF